MGVKTNPKYAEAWMKVRQTRIKSSGMTKVLEKCDENWKSYDRVKAVGGVESEQDCEDYVKVFKEAHAKVEAISRQAGNGFNAKEKALAKSILDDLSEEQDAWEQAKVSYRDGVAAKADSVASVSALRNLVNDRMGKLKETRGKLESIFSTITAADQYRDHSPDPGAYRPFSLALAPFGKLVAEADEAYKELVKAVVEAEKKYKDNDEVKKAHAVVTTTSQPLKDCYGDLAVWKMKVDTVLRQSA